MAESEKDPQKTSTSVSGGDMNVTDRGNGGFEGISHDDKHSHQHRHGETHGLRDDIDEFSSMSDVKAPNVFERAKEEIEALVEALHPKKESSSHDSSSHGDVRDSAHKDYLKSSMSENHSEIYAKTPNFIEKAKEEIASLVHKPHHHKETHGLSADIDENTPISEVKGPNVFERAKEEIEALIQAIHPKKDSRDASSPKKEGGLPESIGRGLEKICSPRSHNKD